MATSTASRDIERSRLQAVCDVANRRGRQSGLRISVADYRELEGMLGCACQKCGATDSLQWDHVIPLAKGGEHHPSNIQRLCRKCNEIKQASHADYRSKGQVEAICQKWPLCRICRVPMRPGIATGQTYSLSPDFTALDECGTINLGGPGTIIPAMKCPQCGHSMTL